MKLIPERLKTSRRLQMEIAAGGLALWYLKNQVYPKYRGPTQGPDILPPASEYVDRSFVSSTPSDFDANGTPRSIQIERSLSSSYIALHARFDSANKAIIENAPKSKAQLIKLKKGIDRATKKINKRQSSSN